MSKQQQHVWISIFSAVGTSGGQAYLEKVITAGPQGKDNPELHQSQAGWILKKNIYQKNVYLQIFLSVLSDSGAKRFLRHELQARLTETAV